MQIQANQTKEQGSGRPWYLLWVLGAITLAGLSVMEFQANGKLSSALIAAAWLCWAFSWYAKPFVVNFRAQASRALIVEPLRTWVPHTLWNFATIGAAALLLVGVLLKYTNAA